MFDIRNITEDEAKKQLEYLAKEIEKTGYCLLSK